MLAAEFISTRLKNVPGFHANMYFEQLFTPRIYNNLQKIQMPEKLIENIPDKGRYIWGAEGTGKTMYAVFVGLSFIKRQSELNALKFISTITLLNLVKKTYLSSEISEIDIIHEYANASVLIIDDLGTEKVTDWAYSILQYLINYRYEYMLPTIITSNYDLEELSKRLGDARISSRISEMCVIVKKDGKIYR